MGMDGRPFEISDDAEGLHRLMDLCESKWDVVASILGVAGLIGTTIMCWKQRDGGGFVSAFRLMDQKERKKGAKGNQIDQTMCKIIIMTAAQGILGVGALRERS